MFFFFFSIYLGFFLEQNIFDRPHILVIYSNLIDMYVSISEDFF